MIFAAPALAQEEAATELDIWRATSGKAALTALEIGKLYASLDEAGLLQFVPYVDVLGRNIQQILRDENKFAGEGFPAEIDRVLCLRNPAVCKPDPADPLGRGIWTNSAGDLLYLPVLEFEEKVVIDAVSRPAGQSVLALMKAHNADCTLFETCEATALQFNANNAAALDESVAAKVVIPRQGFEAQIERPAAVELPSSILRQIVGKGLWSPLSYHREPLYGEQEELLTLINFPLNVFAELNDMPAALRRPIVIAVVDAWLDAEHCDLKQQFTVLRNAPPPDLLPDRGDCGAPGSFSRDIDHGTHVAGLLGAVFNGQAIGGLEPFAKLLFYGIDLSNINAAAAQIDFRDRLLADIFIRKVAIVNVSWKYDVGNQKDLVADVIDTADSEALFVVAAGNEGEFFDGRCPVRPACFASRPNVLTVVGLNRDAAPALWTEENGGSNSGPGFQIGAIAKEVVSIASADRVASASGTSQAAPQVTAAAALVLSAFQSHFGTSEEIPPARLKNRLVYTADMDRLLLQKIFGGRLNVGRAVQVGVDQLTIKDGEVKRSYTGTLTSLGASVDPYLGCDGGAPASRITRDALEPIVKLDRTYAVFFRSDENNPASELLRKADCKLATQSNKATFETQSGAQITFRFDQILDFTSSMH